MSVCVVSHDAELVRHRHMNAAPEAVLKAVAPDRAGLVVAVDGLCTGSWLADRWAAQGIPVVRGHALDLPALHGGQAKHDPLDLPKRAAWLRGGMRPQADVYPAPRRATRDLLRRRPPLRRNRADLWSHVQQTNRQDHLPALGQTMADQANRAGGAERVSAPAGHKTMGVDLARITPAADLLQDLDRALRTTAQHHEATTRDR
jgi:hypothetical protein